jgi:hypothetical protein
VTSILIEPGFVREHGPSEAEEIESLAAQLRVTVRSYPVQVEYNLPRPSPPSDIQFSIPADTKGFTDAICLSINVPWEVLTGAVATIFLETVRDWLKDRYESRYAKHLSQQQAARDWYKDRYKDDERRYAEFLSQQQAGAADVKLN